MRKNPKALTYDWIKTGGRSGVTEQHNYLFSVSAKSLQPIGMNDRPHSHASL